MNTHHILETFGPIARRHAEFDLANETAITLVPELYQRLDHLENCYHHAVKQARVYYDAGDSVAANTWKSLAHTYARRLNEIYANLNALRGTKR